MESDTNRCTIATIVKVLTPTILRVQLSDGRKLSAALSPELRHLSLSRRAKKHSIFTVGKCVEIELSPFSDDKCRVIKILEDGD